MLIGFRKDTKSCSTPIANYKSTKFIFDNSASAAAMFDAPVSDALPVAEPVAVDV